MAVVTKYELGRPQVIAIGPGTPEERNNAYKLDTLLTAWVPQVESGMRVLITGATGGLGRAVVAMLLDGSDCIIGAHGASQSFDKKSSKLKKIQKSTSLARKFPGFVGISNLVFELFAVPKVSIQLFRNTHKF